MSQDIKAQEIINIAQKHGLSIASKQADLCVHYLSLLFHYNQRMNLVGKSTWQDIFTSLVLDSFFLAQFLEQIALPKQPLCLDLGAGAGLPGIPLRMLWENGEYWLVEVRSKRCSFMRTALAHLSLQQTFVFEGKAQNALQHIAKQKQKTQENCLADLIISRAFMPWEKLLPFVRLMLKPKARLVVLANTDVPNKADFLDTWKVEKTNSYAVENNTRWFWSLQVG